MSWEGTFEIIPIKNMSRHHSVAIKWTNRQRDLVICVQVVSSFERGLFLVHFSSGGVSILNLFTFSSCEAPADLYSFHLCAVH